MYLSDLLRQFIMGVDFLVLEEGNSNTGVVSFISEEAKEQMGESAFVWLS